MFAYNWKDENVDPQWLLNRYAMQVQVASSGLHVVGIRETSGRAQLRNVVMDTEDRVHFLWTWSPDGPNPPLDEPTKMEWHDVLMRNENQLNLVVNNQSYYWPRAGQRGAHVVTPKLGGDTVTGWGLAQDLADQPTGDNRYQTLIVYWGDSSGPVIPPPVIPPPVDPGTPPNPQPGTIRATGRLYGVHAPKDGISDDDFRKWQEIQPGLVTLTPPSMNPETVQRLRRDIPGVVILGRFFGSPEVNAWRPPYWDAAAMRQYGQYCRIEAERIGLDICVFANEPGIDDPDQNGNEHRFGEWWWTKEGYQTLASGCDAWLSGFNAVPGRCLSGTLPLSPGHHEYDDPDNTGWKGSDFLGPVFRKFGCFVSHDYYDRNMGSETAWYRGGTLLVKLQAYQWPANKPVAISEWNRDEPKDAPFGDAERDADVLQAEHFIEQYRSVPNFLGATRFIWRSDSYPRLSVYEDWRQNNLAKRINSKGGNVVNPQNIDSQITVTELGQAVRGRPMRIVLHASRKDTGQPVPRGSLLTVLFKFTRKKVDGVDFAPIPSVMKVLPTDEGGKVVAEIEIPATAVPSSEASEGASFEAFILGLADLLPEVPGTDTQFTGSTVQNVTILAEAPNNPPPGPNPDQPGPTPTPTGQSMWGYLVLIHNTVGDVDNLLQQGKIAEARAANVQQQVTVKQIKEMMGFP